MPRARAGWYDDPQVQGQRRYWDGEVWTDRTADVDQAPAPRRSWPRWEAAGIIGALLIWPVGLIISIVLIAKGSTTKTPWVVLVISVLAGVYTAGEFFSLW